MRQKWEREYERLKIPDLSGKKILFAYNLCIDKIKHVRDISWIRHPPASRHSMVGMEDLHARLLRCMKNGIADEMVFSDESMKKELERLGFDEMRLGGQSGIMANYAALLSASPIVYPYHVGREIKERLDARIFSVKRGELVSLKELGEGEAFPHFVFEFEEGEIEPGFRIPRDNRFIASFVTDRLDFDEDFETILSEIDVDFSVFSGFHLILENYRKGTYRDAMERIKSNMETVKKKNCRVHCEMAAIPPKILTHMSGEIFPLTDSIGLNEVELSSICECLGHECRRDIISLYDGMVFLAERFSLKRIHLHDLGYYLCLTKNPRKERDGLLFSSIAAATRARLGEIRDVEEIMASKRIPISEKGIGQLKRLSLYLGSRRIYEEGFYGNLACVPTKVIENPKSTVGLGDTISSAFFLREEDP